MKRIFFNHLKPQYYYNKLFVFFLVVTFVLASSLSKFDYSDMEQFLLRFFVIFFLIITLSALIEFKSIGDYMGPLEIYDLEIFAKEFMLDILKENFKYEKYFNKYDSKSRQRFNKYFLKKVYMLSTIRKHENIYEITIIDEQRMFEFFFFRFLGKKGVHKLFVKREGKKKFRIIRFV